MEKELASMSKQYGKLMNKDYLEQLEATVES